MSQHSSSFKNTLNVRLLCEGAGTLGLASWILGGGGGGAVVRKQQSRMRTDQARVKCYSIELSIAIGIYGHKYKSGTRN